MKKVILLAAVALCALGGCAGTDTLSKIRNADAKDHSTLAASVVTPYGRGDAVRINPATNQSAKVTLPNGTIIEIQSK